MCSRTAERLLKNRALSRSAEAAVSACYELTLIVQAVHEPGNFSRRLLYFVPQRSQRVGQFLQAKLQARFHCPKWSARGGGDFSVA